MKVFNKCFVFLELLVQFLSVASYTVVLKQVKPVHPSLKVYRYELRHPKILQEGNTQYIYHKPILGQRIYPVVGKSGSYKTRGPVKKLYKVTSTTEKPAVRDPRLLGLPLHLVPPVSNKIEEHSEGKDEEAREEENDIRPLVASPHAGKSFSSFGQEKGRIYNNQGDWATPVPQADSENTTKAEFTPSQLYLQIRHKNTVIHVPQSEALKDAETLEELINAPRLKQLSRTTHVQETYSEEGYEDAGYDHAGHIRQAQHGEVYDAKDEGKFNIKDPPIILDYDSDLEESKKVPLKNAIVKQSDSAEHNLSNKLEPRITHSRSEISKTSVEYSKTPKNYKGDHKYSSRVKSPPKIAQNNETGFNLTDMKQFLSAPPTFPSYFGEVPPTPETPLLNDSALSYVPPGKLSSKYRKGDLNSTKIYAVSDMPPTQANEYTDFNPYISLIDSQVSPSAKSLKYSRIYSKKTKQLRLEPYQSDSIYSPPPPPPSPNPETLPPTVLQPPRVPDQPEEEEPINQRIVLPTIGYINSLTTAHFGKGNVKPEQEEPKTELTDALNLTQALNYLRSNKNQKNAELTKFPPVPLATEIDIRTFEPMKLKKSRANSRSFVGKTKRDVYLTGESRKEDKKQEKYEGDDESDLPHNEKNEEIAEDERKRIEEENKEKEKYESDLRQEISNQEKEIIKETYKNIGVVDDVSEVFPEFPPDSDAEFSSFPEETTPTPVDTKKYPFYMSKKLPENSALRYATDPKQFPKKSGYKMEFYDSRERVIQCPDFHPDLKDLPDSNSTEYSDDQAGENQRLTGVGDKILCLRMKYFDPEPFDNPIFKEREIDYVGKRLKRPKKVQPKDLKVNKDQKFQQTNHEKSFLAKPENQKPYKEFNSDVTASHSVKANFTGQAIPHEIKNQPVNQIKVFSLAQPKTNKTEQPRIIPVTEIVDEFPPTTAKTIQKKSNPRSAAIGWKTTYRSASPTQVRPQPSDNKKHIVKPHNCLPYITKLAALDGKKNLTIHCNDAMLIQEIINNAAQLRIIPKETNTGETAIKRKWSEKIPVHKSGDQTDWVPIAGYVPPRQVYRSLYPLSRRTDEITGSKNESTHNSSAMYVIDELKEDENVRKGEVVEDMDHYMRLLDGLKDDVAEVTTVKTETKTENSTRKKREAPSDPVKVQKQENFPKKPESSLSAVVKTTQAPTKDGAEKPLEGALKLFEVKRTLTRLSGLDFLTRYHKNKGKSGTQNAEDFWKITPDGPNPTKSDQKPTKKNKETEKPVRTTSKSNEKLDKTTNPQPTRQTNTQKLETKETSEFRKPQANSSGERNNKPKNKYTNEPRKFSPLNLIPEKITKRPPELKASEFWKTFSQNRPTDITTTTTSKPQNFTKIITKVSTATSESSEKPRVVYKKSNKTTTTTTEKSVFQSSSTKPETLQYQTINRSSTPKSTESENLSRATDRSEGPILYYVVNLKTGIGKWITNYEEPRRVETGKHGKTQKLKEASGDKRDKRRKKSKLKN